MKDVAIKDAIYNLVAFMNAKEFETRPRWSTTDMPYAYFEIVPGGKKYIKIAMRYNNGGGGSVHCFVDSTNGDVLKAAGWKTPAKGARYNLMDPDSLAKLKRNWDWAGGYLYLDTIKALDKREASAVGV